MYSFFTYQWPFWPWFKCQSIEDNKKSIMLQSLFFSSSIWQTKNNVRQTIMTRRHTNKHLSGCLCKLNLRVMIDDRCVDVRSFSGHFAHQLSEQCQMSTHHKFYCFVCPRKPTIFVTCHPCQSWVFITFTYKRFTSQIIYLVIVQDSKT